MALTESEKANFETLRHAIVNSRVALLECKEILTGHRVAVVCAYNVDNDGNMEFVPLAKFFAVNPYQEIVPVGREEEAPVEVPKVPKPYLFM